MIFEKYFAKDEVQYDKFIAEYMNLVEEDKTTAYKLSQIALGLADRWSNIVFETKRMEDTVKDTAYKERARDRYNILLNIVTHTRMVWGQAKVQMQNNNGRDY